MQHKFVKLYLVASLLFSMSAASQQHILTFNRPQSSPQTNYIIELLTLAYHDIGYTLHIIDFSKENALVAANSGVLDGQLGRNISIESHYRNLQRVDYSLLTFNLMLYQQCIPTPFAQLPSITVLTGSPVQSFYLQEMQFAGDIIRVKNISTQLNLLLQQKVAGALLLDFSANTEVVYAAHTCMQTQRLTRYSLYHYLHKRHNQLQPKITQALIKLHSNGTVYALKAKYNIAN